MNFGVYKSKYLNFNHNICHYMNDLSKKTKQKKKNKTQKSIKRWTKSQRKTLISSHNFLIAAAFALFVFIFYRFVSTNKSNAGVFFANMRLKLCLPLFDEYSLNFAYFVNNFDCRNWAIECARRTAALHL